MQSLVPCDWDDYRSRFWFMNLSLLSGCFFPFVFASSTHFQKMWWLCVAWWVILFGPEGYGHWVFQVKYVSGYRKTTFRNDNRQTFWMGSQEGRDQCSMKNYLFCFLGIWEDSKEKSCKLVFYSLNMSLGYWI